MLPDLTGKVALVTGANTGIGEVTALELARAGARVYLACRSREKADAAIDRMRQALPDADLRFLPLDLTSFDSVRAAAAEFLATGDPLHLLINNAGVAGVRGTTADGFELMFGTNHLGHFLLTLLLLDRVVASAPARIVNVSSRGHYRVGGIDLDAQQQATPSYSGFPEYCVSKLANVLFTQSLHERLQGSGVTTYSLHPGGVASDIWGRRLPGWVVAPLKLLLITVEEGARTTLHCATDPDAPSGLYWDRCKPKTPSRPARDAALAAALWARSLQWTGAPDWPRGPQST